MTNESKPDISKNTKEINDTRKSAFSEVERLAE
jgi:hypothetical protein